MAGEKIVVLIVFFLGFFAGGVEAQYVNTDSLVVVPGHSPMLTIRQVRSIQKQEKSVNPPFLSEFILPGNSRAIISRFGPRSGRMHYGTDIKMQKGDTVVAVNDGTVVRAGWGYGFGNIIILQHRNNIQTYYAHLSEFIVQEGGWVAKGEPIGLAGSTGRARGSHLHFEIHENDRAFDPELVFDFEKQQVRKEAGVEENLVALHSKLKPQGYSKNVAVPEFYKVRPGDSLWVISRRFKTSVKEICRLNRISETTVLQIGQPLKMY
jgi:LysM repeat protein